jgi:tetraacyldisaccharide 4'-kinase
MMVNPLLHTAREVGDEPLLLARMLPTIVAKRRQDGAKLAAAYGAEMLIMDDGFQNPSLIKDLSLLVIDGTYGFGNGHVIPAGPLREPVSTALARADAVIVVNPTDTTHLPIPENLPTIRAHTSADKSISAFKEKEVVAFCGIAQPQKFFTMLESHGVNVAQRIAFGDHHPYTSKEIESLLAQGMPLLTTAKDMVRIPAPLRQHMTVIEISLEFEDKQAVDRLIHRLPVQ